MQPEEIKSTRMLGVAFNHLTMYSFANSNWSFLGSLLDLLIAPIIMNGKVFIQDIIIRKLSWNEPNPGIVYGDLKNDFLNLST